MADGDVSLRFRLLGSDDGASRAFDKVGKSSDHLSTRMVAVGTAIGHLAASGVMALGGMAAGAIKTGIQTAAAMQQAQLGFATLLGSEKAAGDYMKWLTGFAASTPFELKGLVESSRTLIGVGVSAKDAKVMLQNFGDTASAIGIDQDAFQRVMLATSQAISAGKFQAGDLNQIMTNGIPVWTILSKAMHKSVPEIRALASHGKLLAKDVLPALQAEMHKDYGGAMAKQSQTLNGLWSTFQDTLHLGMANVLQPLIPILQSVLPGAMDALGKAFTAAAGGVKDFIDGLTGHVEISKSHSALMNLGMGVKALAASFKDGDVTSDGFVGQMERLGVKARELKKAFEDAWPKVQAALQFVADHSTAFGSLATSIGTVIVAMRAWAAVTAILAIAQAALDVVLAANPIGLIVLAIAALVAGLVYAYTHSEKFRDIVNGAFNAVKDVVLAAVGALVAVFHGMAEAWDAFLGGFQNPGATIGESVGTVTRIFLTLGSVVGTVVGWFQTLPGRIMAGVAALPGLLWAFIKTTAEHAAYLFGFGLGLMIRAAIEIPQKIGQAIAALPEIVARWVLTTGVRAVVAWVNFNTALIAKAYALTGQLISWVAALVPKVVAWFGRLPGLVVAALRALPGQVKAVFSAAGTWLLEAGKQVVAGLVNGIKGAFSSALSAIKDLGGNLISGFKAGLGISSPAKKMIPLGQEVINGIEVGLRQRAPAVFNFLESFAQRIGNIKVTAGVKNMLGKLATETAADMRAATAKLDRVATAIKDQQAKVADLIKAKKDYANTLAQGVSGGAITNIGLTTQATDAEGNTTDLTPQQQAAAFLESMKTKVRAIHMFADNMDALRAKGLSQDVLQQIAQSGLDTGGALAAALATATPETIRGVNGMAAQINQSSDRFGAEWAGKMYDSGIKAAEGLLKGLKSREAAILAMIRSLAQQIVAEIKHTLKIKSPSGVMQDEVGAMIPAGLIAGIQAGAGGVAAAMRSLVAVPTMGARIGLGGSIAASGAGAGVTNIHLHVPNGFVGSPDQLATALSDVMSRAKARGLNLSFA